ncbi:MULTISPECIES: 1-acylglycerol-3-phosphate O-acyltransferase [unclassified Shewanella]|uniref:1-acylglycerol-3-phosphate O-acyltransferase n=1 Tax=unclassified Shewanella TaxID=196818 RepID=UPI000C851C3D|nr:MULTISPECIES: 1-acylglycerol-3-phosphate O-acyltransferase [unclassified Shewanella]MDO6620258.1 1-acylglycerol-3-phosphate O-acyltransferase [Shewanella sp. 6_MG-2023]MDO6638565.1 1-acylglycerol-3-phosphate O-acyltransferase [Shewanella sp. 5_MG-2023]MDO6679536.1 1-acylglycerol-3-phosphate O-acyltransferase [Shewanella sp. 4_MG-2023]PMG32274.1 acyl-phosphate glycerol 3-phosphate acyltransferase [Shewanella sp. 10N.286.52.C2]PMG45254.1 acyl-phosphate glycerol 3-phosphate acyltransferase [Sh
MLLIARSIILAVLLTLAFFFAIILCIVRPMHRDNVHVIAKLFSSVAPILGIKVITRNAVINPQVDTGAEANAGTDTETEASLKQPKIYLANHQNNFDLFTHTSAVPEATVSLGKKSLAWMPLFGQIYWLSGNILIDRKNRHSAFDTMAKTVKRMREKLLSVWIFPEGTRSRGRGLLPFKVGAFHTAIAAKASIVPVLASCQNHIKLNKWNNGVVIVEMMAPMSTANVDKADAKKLCAKVHQVMSQRLAELNQEASLLMAKPQ